MTRRLWLASLRRRGARLSLAGDGRLRVRGRMTAMDRRRLARDRAGLVRLLRARRRRREVREGEAAPEEAPVIGMVGTVARGYALVRGEHSPLLGRAVMRALVEARRDRGW